MEKDKVYITEDMEDLAYAISLKIEEIESFVKIFISAVENTHTELDVLDIKNTSVILLNAATQLKNAQENFMDEMRI